MSSTALMTLSDPSALRDITNFSIAKTVEEQKLLWPRNDVVTAIDLGGSYRGQYASRSQTEFTGAASAQDLTIGPDGRAKTVALAGLDRTTVETIEKALGGYITDQEVVEAGISGLVEPMQDLSDKIAGRILNEAELLLSALMFTATNWDATHRFALSIGDATNGAEWDRNDSNPMPYEVAEKLIRIVQLDSGITGNTLIVGRDALFGASLSEKLRGDLPLTEPRSASDFMGTMARLANMFRVNPNRVFIAESSYFDGTNDVFMWGDSIWYGYIDPAPRKNTKSAAARFSSWEYKTLVPPTKGEREEHRTWYTEFGYRQTLKVTNQPAGGIITNVSKAF